MADHYLKTWPVHFQDVKSGKKKLEIRKADRPFQVNDNLVLQEWSPETEKYSGEVEIRTVTHVLKGGQFGLEKGYVAMSII